MRKIIPLALAALFFIQTGCVSRSPTSVFNSIPVVKSIATVAEGEYLQTKTRLVAVRDPQTGAVHYVPTTEITGVDGHEILTRGIAAALP